MCVASSPAAGQVPAPTAASHDSIIAVVEQFFTAMEARDTAAIRRLFLPDARLARLEHRPDSSVIGSTSIEEFLRQLPGARARLRERMWDPQVLEHRGLAVVWAPYDFRLDDRFSHCGVDAFTLLRSRDGWRFAGMAYTAEPTGCPDGPAADRRAAE
ncbi:MAG: nuclear transport factor 2 family protein [Gemmatimonadota bacterium]